MRRTTWIVALIGSLAVLAVPALLWAQENQPVPPAAGQPDRTQDMQARRALWMRAAMLMHMQVEPGDPNALIAAKDSLKLDDQQVNKLKDIQDRTDRIAEAFLTPDQKKTLDNLQEAPGTMMAMHQKMESGGQPGQKLECPMMKRMKEKGVDNSIMMERMRRRCDIMMNMQVKNSNPKAILAVKNELGLNPVQVGQLAQYAESARQDALKVLTPPQLDQVKALRNTPQNMMEMHRAMMKDGDKGCPMMDMMDSAEPKDNTTAPK